MPCIKLKSWQYFFRPKYSSVTCVSMGQYVKRAGNKTCICSMCIRSKPLNISTNIDRVLVGKRVVNNQYLKFILKVDMHF